MPIQLLLLTGMDRNANANRSVGVDRKSRGRRWGIPGVRPLSAPRILTRVFQNKLACLLKNWQSPWIFDSERLSTGAHNDFLILFSQAARLTPSDASLERRTPLKGFSIQHGSCRPKPAVIVERPETSKLPSFFPKRWGILDISWNLSYHLCRNG